MTNQASNNTNQNPASTTTPAIAKAFPMFLAMEWNNDLKCHTGFVKKVYAMSGLSGASEEQKEAFDNIAKAGHIRIGTIRSTGTVYIRGSKKFGENFYPLNGKREDNITPVNECGVSCYLVLGIGMFEDVKREKGKIVYDEAGKPIIFRKYMAKYAKLIKTTEDGAGKAALEAEMKKGYGPGSAYHVVCPLIIISDEEVNFTFYTPNGKKVFLSSQTATTPIAEATQNAAATTVHDIFPDVMAETEKTAQAMVNNMVDDLPF